MKAKRQINGDWCLTAEASDFDREGPLIHAIWAMEDCSLDGEEYCLSNTDMAIDLYDWYTGKDVRLIYSLIDQMKPGSVLICKAREREYYEGDRVLTLSDLAGTIIEITEAGYILELDDGTRAFAQNITPILLD